MNRIWAWLTYRKPNSLESRLRLLIRSTTWRITAFFISTSVGWVITGDLLTGAKLGVLYNILAFWTHLIHDVIWTKTRWGVAPLSEAKVELDEPADSAVNLATYQG